MTSEFMRRQPSEGHPALDTLAAQIRADRAREMRRYATGAAAFGLAYLVWKIYNMIADAREARRARAYSVYGER